MRHTNWKLLISLLAAAPIALAVSSADASELGPGIQTVSDQAQADKSNDETNTRREDSSEERSEFDDSGRRADKSDDQLLGHGAPGLELGSDSSETDQVLANFDKNRDEDADSSDDSSDDSTSQTIAMPDNTSDSHPCEPYPSCTRADLGSKDGVDATPFQQIARQNADAIHKCYTAQLEENSDLAGRLVLQFTVTSDGKPTDITVKSSTLDSDTVAKCAVDTVAEWSFPKPSEYGYDSLTVTHPYSFRSE